LFGSVTSDLKQQVTNIHVHLSCQLYGAKTSRDVLSFS